MDETTKQVIETAQAGGTLAILNTTPDRPATRAGDTTEAPGNAATHTHGQAGAGVTLDYEASLLATAREQIAILKRIAAALGVKP
jgi:hypothetical protein